MQADRLGNYVPWLRESVPLRPAHHDPPTSVPAHPCSHQHPRPNNCTCICTFDLGRARYAANRISIIHGLYHFIPCVRHCFDRRAIPQIPPMTADRFRQINWFVPSGPSDCLCTPILRCRGCFSIIRRATYDNYRCLSCDLRGSAHHGAPDWTITNVTWWQARDSREYYLGLNRGVGLFDRDEDDIDPYGAAIAMRDNEIAADIATGDYSRFREARIRFVPAPLVAVVSTVDFNCGICLESVSRYLPTCANHFFCFDCVSNLFADNSPCPMCRAPAAYSGSLLDTRRPDFVDTQISQSDPVNDDASHENTDAQTLQQSPASASASGGRFVHPAIAFASENQGAAFVVRLTYPRANVIFERRAPPTGAYRRPPVPSRVYVDEPASRARNTFRGLVHRSLGLPSNQVPRNHMTFYLASRLVPSTIPHIAPLFEIVTSQHPDFECEVYRTRVPLRRTVSNSAIIARAPEVEIPTIVGGAGDCWRRVPLMGFIEAERPDRMTSTEFVELASKYRTTLCNFNIKWEHDDDGDFHVVECRPREFMFVDTPAPVGWERFADFLDILRAHTFRKSSQDSAACVEDLDYLVGHESERRFENTVLGDPIAVLDAVTEIYRRNIPEAPVHALGCELPPIAVPPAFVEPPLASITLPPLPVDPGSLIPPPVVVQPPFDFDFSGLPAWLPFRPEIADALDHLSRFFSPATSLLEILGHSVQAVASGAPFAHSLLRIIFFLNQHRDDRHDNRSVFHTSAVFQGDLSPVIQEELVLRAALNQNVLAPVARRRFGIDSWTANSISMLRGVGGQGARAGALINAAANFDLANEDGRYVYLPASCSDATFQEFSAAVPDFRVTRARYVHPHGVAAAARLVSVSRVVAKLHQLGNPALYLVGASVDQVCMFQNVVHNVAPVLSGRDYFRHNVASNPANREFANRVRCPLKLQDCDHSYQGAVMTSLYSAHDIPFVDFCASMARRGIMRAYVVLNLPVPLLDRRLNSYTDSVLGLKYEVHGDEVHVLHTGGMSAGYIHSLQSILSWLVPRCRIPGFHVMAEEVFSIGSSYCLEVVVAPGAQESYPQAWSLQTEPFLMLPILEPVKTNARERFYTVPSRRFRAFVTFVAALSPADATFHNIVSKLRGLLGEVRIGEQLIEERWELDLPEFFSTVGHGVIAATRHSHNYQVSLRKILALDYADRARSSRNFYGRFVRYVKDVGTWQINRKDGYRDRDLWDKLLDWIFLAKFDADSYYDWYTTRNSWSHDFVESRLLPLEVLPVVASAVVKFAPALVDHARRRLRRVEPIFEPPDIFDIDDDLFNYEILHAPRADRMRDAPDPMQVQDAPDEVVRVHHPRPQRVRRPGRPFMVHEQPGIAVLLAEAVGIVVDPANVPLPDDDDEDLAHDLVAGVPLDAMLEPAENVPAVGPAVDPPGVIALEHAPIFDVAAQEPALIAPAVAPNGVANAEHALVPEMIPAPHVIAAAPAVGAVPPAPDAGGPPARRIDFEGEEPDAIFEAIVTDEMIAQYRTDALLLPNLPVWPPPDVMSRCAARFYDLYANLAAWDAGAEFFDAPCPDSGFFELFELILHRQRPNYPVELPTHMAVPATVQGELRDHLMRFARSTYWRRMARCPQVCISGVPSSAKSSLVRDYCVGHQVFDVCVVVPSHALRRDWERQADNHFRVHTQHDLPPAAERVRLLVIDECYSIDAATISLWLRFAEARRTPVVLIGDPFQRIADVGGLLPVDHPVYSTRRLNLFVGNSVSVVATHSIAQYLGEAQRELLQTRSMVDSGVFWTSNMHQMFRPVVDIKMRPHQFSDPAYDPHEDTVGRAQGTRARSAALSVAANVGPLRWLREHNAAIIIGITRGTRVNFLQSNLEVRGLCFPGVGFELFDNAEVVNGFRARIPFSLDVYPTRRFFTDQSNSVVAKSSLPVSSRPLEVFASHNLVADDYSAPDPMPFTKLTFLEMQQLVYANTNFDLLKDHSHAVDFIAPRPARLSSITAPPALVTRSDVRCGFIDAHKMADVQVSSSQFESLRNFILRNLTPAQSRFASSRDYSNAGELILRLSAAFGGQCYGANLCSDGISNWLAKRADAFVNNCTLYAGETKATVTYSSFLKTQPKVKAKAGFAAMLNYGQQVISHHNAIASRLANAQGLAFERAFGFFRSGVLLDIGFSDDELARLVRSLGLDFNENTQLDISRQDSCHNASIVLAFCWFLEQIGIDPADVDLYFQFRSYYAIKSLDPHQHAGAVSWALPSGDPFTLLANCFMMLVSIADRFTFESCVRTSLIQKGDDCLTTSVLIARPEAEVLLPDVVFKTSFNAYPYHAGRFWVGRRFVADPVRVLFRHFARLEDPTVPVQAIYDSYIDRQTEISAEEYGALYTATRIMYDYLDDESLDICFRSLSSLRDYQFFLATCTHPANPVRVISTPTDCAVTVARALSIPFPGRLRGKNQQFVAEFFSSRGFRVQIEEEDFGHVVLPDVIIVSPRHCCIVLKDPERVKGFNLSSCLLTHHQLLSPQPVSVTKLASWACNAFQPRLSSSKMSLSKTSVSPSSLNQTAITSFRPMPSLSTPPLLEPVMRGSLRSMTRARLRPQALPKNLGRSDSALTSADNSWTLKTTVDSNTQSLSSFATTPVSLQPRLMRPSPKPPSSSTMKLLASEISSRSSDRAPASGK